MYVPRFVRYAFACMAMCFGTFAFAAVDPVGYGYTLKHTLADAGEYGALSAKFVAEQSHMANQRPNRAASLCGLIRDSHGYLQASADEVTEGTTGSTVSLS